MCMYAIVFLQAGESQGSAYPTSNRGEVSPGCRESAGDQEGSLSYEPMSGAKLKAGWSSVGRSWVSHERVSGF